MDFSNYKAISIPEGNVVQISAGNRVIWALTEPSESYKNWVEYSTEEDGVTIYNGGQGYKDGYRVRSGGAEGTHSAASVTGFIPVKGGDIVRMSGYNAKTTDAGNAINVYNASKTNLGQAVANYANAGYGIFASGAAYTSYGWASVTENPTGVYVWTVPPSADIAFMRVTGLTNADGSKMIVTINEEIV